MDHALTSLIAASVAFVGTHFALSHPLRGAVVRMAGERGFQGVYSLVALATFAWMVLAFRAVGPGGAPLWDGMGFWFFEECNRPTSVLEAQHMQLRHAGRPPRQPSHLSLWRTS